MDHITDETEKMHIPMVEIERSFKQFQVSLPLKETNNKHVFIWLVVTKKHSCCLSYSTKVDSELTKTIKKTTGCPKKGYKFQKA